MAYTDSEHLETVEGMVTFPGYSVPLEWAFQREILDYEVTSCSISCAARHFSLSICSKIVYYLSFMYNIVYLDSRFYFFLFFIDSFAT